jgi:hypothetical protein
VPQQRVQLFLRILQADAIPICSRRRDIPGRLAEAIHRALAKTPADRFKNVGLFREALLKSAC